MKFIPSHFPSHFISSHFISSHLKPFLQVPQPLVHSLLGCTSCNRVCDRDVNAALNIADVYYNSINQQYGISQSFTRGTPKRQHVSNWTTKIQNPRRHSTDPLKFLDFSKATSENVDDFINEIAHRKREKLQARLKKRKEMKKTLRQNQTRVCGGNATSKNPDSSKEL